MSTTLYRDAALADGHSPEPRIGVSVLVRDGVIVWIRPSADEGETGSANDLEVIDASGTTIVPGMVDCHSHLTLPGGAHWIDRGFDSTDSLLAYAEHNARLMRRAGVYWARDVGSPTRVDPHDGRERGLAIGLRERWHGRREYPYVRAAGTWVSRRASLPTGLALEADTGDELLALALRQLDDGADFVKLYLDGPDRDVAPWSAAEVRAVVDAAAVRGKKVTAHSGNLAGAKVGVAAGIHSIEHGFELDADVCREMAQRGIFLVSTLAVLHSVLTFGRTTTLPRFASPDGRSRIMDQLARAHGERPPGPCGRRRNLRRYRLRRRLAARQPAGVGGRVACRGGTRAVAGTRCRDVAWWRDPGRARSRNSSARVARPTSYSFTGIPPPTRRASGGSGEPLDRRPRVAPERLEGDIAPFGPTWSSVRHRRVCLAPNGPPVIRLTQSEPPGP